MEDKVTTINVQLTRDLIKLKSGLTTAHKSYDNLIQDIQSEHEVLITTIKELLKRIHP